MVTGGYFSPRPVGVKYPACSRRCSTFSRGDNGEEVPFGITCDLNHGTCDESETVSRGICQCARFYFRDPASGIDCALNKPPSGNGSAETTFALYNVSNSISDTSGKYDIAFPANSFPDGFAASVTMDVYLSSDITVVAAALEAGVTAKTDLINMGPEGTVFKTPVTLTMSAGAGTSPAVGKRMSILYYNKASLQWEEVTEGRNYDAATGKISCQIEHFSMYVGAEVNDTTPTPAPTPPSPPAPPPAPAPPPVAIGPVEGTQAPTGTPPPAEEEGGSPLGAIVGAVVAVLVLGGGAGFYFYTRGRATAPIVPLRTGGDGLEEPLIEAQISADQAATGVDAFVAEAASPARNLPVEGVPAAVEPGEPEPASAEPVPEAAMDEGMPGTASTAQTSGANFGTLNAVMDEDGYNDTPTASRVERNGVGFGHGFGGQHAPGAVADDSSDSDIVVAFVPDIESDDSNEIQ